MTKKTNNKILKFNKPLIPRAYLKDSNIVFLIVELQVKKGAQYAFLNPPDYQIKETVPKYMLDAAVAKYFYEPIETEVIIKDYRALLRFIKTLTKQ